jgi:membrane associated rhomboid family serine protease
MSYSFADEQEPPTITPAVKWLISANVAILFLQLTVVGDATITQLGFKQSDLHGRWWTIFTYMFVHGGLLHCALNMYTLWLFGRRVEHVWSPGAFTRFYVWCGLGGWLFHLLLVRGDGGILVGASAAVFGVMLAYTMRWPDDEVFLMGVLPIKVKWLVTGLVLINMVQGLATGGTGGVGYFAHLGGLAFGWLYLRTPSAQSIEKLRQRVSQIPDIQDETPRAIPRSLPRQRERERGNEVDEIVAKSKAVVTKRQPAVRPAVLKKGDDRIEQLNLVLDKISQKGLHSLTADERRLLEEMSRELRKD